MLNYVNQKPPRLKGGWEKRGLVDDVRSKIMENYEQIRMPNLSFNKKSYEVTVEPF